MEHVREKVAALPKLSPIAKHFYRTYHVVDLYTVEELLGLAIPSTYVWLLMVRSNVGSLARAMTMTLSRCAANKYHDYPLLSPVLHLLPSDPQSVRGALTLW